MLNEKAVTLLKKKITTTSATHKIQAKLETFQTKNSETKINQ